LKTSASDVPASLIRIAHLLCADGHPGVVLPACLDCGQAPVRLPMLVASGRVCVSCARIRALPVCSRCGRKTKLTGERARSSGMCRSCRAAIKAPELCATCGRPSRIKKRLPDGGGLCQNCHQVREVCAQCRTLTRIFRCRADGTGLCQRCYAPPAAECVPCSRSGARSHQRRAGLRSLSPAATTALWPVRRSPTVAHPSRTPGRPPKGSRRADPAWAHWTLLRRARSRLDHRPFAEGAAHAMRQAIRAALGLLTWIDDNELTLAGTTQHAVDRWLTEGNPGAYQARDFLQWARSRGLAAQADIPLRQPRTALAPLSEEQRWDRTRLIRTPSALLRSELRSSSTSRYTRFQPRATRHPGSLRPCDQQRTKNVLAIVFSVLPISGAGLY